MALVYIGLGTNLGDRSGNLAAACNSLLLNEKIKLINKSSIEETAPVDYHDQPSFLNQVILVRTGMHPVKLLGSLKKIEKKMGRKKTFPKGPRIIDLDILLYDDIVLSTKRLVIPHPEIKRRWFVLKHLIEIDPDLSDPLTGTLYSDIYKKPGS